jgi:hypothetical protein
MLERRRRRRKIPRLALLGPLHSPWRQLYNSKNDQSLITLTGFDYTTFDWFSKIFTPIYESYSPFIDSDGHIVLKKSSGRDRFINGTDCLLYALHGQELVAQRCLFN